MRQNAGFNVLILGSDTRDQPKRLQTPRTPYKSSGQLPGMFFVLLIIMSLSMLMVLAGAGWTWNKWDCDKWIVFEPRRFLQVFGDKLNSELFRLNLNVFYALFLAGRHIVYDPNFKRRLLDPRIKCWQKPTLIHSVVACRSHARTEFLTQDLIRMRFGSTC